MKRRDFINHASLGALLIALHPEACFSNSSPSNTPLNTVQSKQSLIENIRLLTSTSLKVMKEFYLTKMRFVLQSESASEITFIAGQSTVTFVKVDKSYGDPWYHFAFNIPENKLLKARDWHLKHTSLIPTPKRARDPKYPDDVRHFPHWNAHSLFFWDPAGNLLEYIARHDLKNSATGSFTSKDILNISEIAFVVDDQQLEAKTIHNKLGLDVYPKTTDFWWAMGDENGLLLCIPKRLWGENTSKPKRFGIHRTEATIRGLEAQTYTFSNFPYGVKVRKG